MVIYISVPLKKTTEVDIVKPLKNLISSYYSTSDEPLDCTEAVTELNKLRMNATWKTLDKHESSLEAMYRYYDQLSSLESKCPPNDVQIPFKWKDAFSKGSWLGGSASLTISSLKFEKACVLFNIAAMQSQIASSLGTEVTQDELIKSAAKYFQQASGIFLHLKNTVMSTIQQEPTADMMPDTLSCLQVIMVAQAQETFFHKATTDGMKDTVVAKVAAQCEEVYADALKQMQKESLRNLWEKDWIPVIAGKQAAFRSLAEYYQSLVCKQKKEVGEELARLQHSLELMKAAESRAGLTFGFKDFSSRIAKAYEDAKKDNDFIYHAKVPDVKSLPPIGKAVLAKPIPMADKFAQNTNDLFSAFLPLSVQQVLQVFDLRKSELVNGEIGRMREQTQTMNAILASLNLPASIEETSGSALPASIQEKAATTRNKGGIESILRQIEELPSLLMRNKEILDECERMLNEEEDSDKQLKQQFGDNWKRTPSQTLNTPLRQSCEKYRMLINNAVNADQKVKQKFDQHRAMIEVLSRPDDQVKAAIPAASPTASLQNSRCVQQLRQLMAEVNRIKEERERLESELKSPTLDIKAKFLNALSQDGAINEEAMSIEYLGEMFGETQKRIRENLTRQESTLSSIQEYNNEFVNEKSSNQTSVKRDDVLRDMASAYDVFMELSTDLQDGVKFYNTTTQILLNFQNKINDFCFARKTEKEEMCRDMQQSIVNRPNPPTPTPPSHHGGATSKPTPPPRPPPPTAPASVGAAAVAPSYPNPPYPIAMPPAFPAYPYPAYGGYPPAVPGAYAPYPQYQAANPAAPSQPYPQQPYQGAPTVSYPYPQQRWP